MNPTILALFNVGGGELILLLFLFAFTAFPVWMLIDCVKYEAGAKVAWAVVIFLTGPFGAAIYYFTNRLPRLRAARATPPLATAVDLKTTGNPPPQAGT